MLSGAGAGWGLLCERGYAELPVRVRSLQERAWEQVRRQQGRGLQPSRRGTGPFAYSRYSRYRLAVQPL
jgi:hypothetical protein